MVCELHFEVKTAILVIAINTAVQGACSLWNNLPNCSRGMNMGSIAVQWLNDYVSALSYWRKKQNKTKLGGSSFEGADWKIGGAK